jgi:hypothetical protein
MYYLQIGIPCGPNSEHYANFLISSIERTISRKFAYQYVVGINKAGVDRSVIQKNLENIDIVYHERISSHDGSRGHGDCLNLIFEHMTSRFGVLVDADVAFLCKNWDILLIDQLDSSTVMIGSEYHPTDGKMVDRPNVITCAFDTNVLKSLSVNFMPSLTRLVADEHLAKVFGCKLSQTFFLDTGCDMIKQLIDAGYTTKTLKIISPRYEDTVRKIKLLKNNEKGEEYHMGDIVICTHIGRSLSRNFASDPVVDAWKSRVSAWLDGKI